MTYRFWVGITIFYFFLLVLAAIWEGGAVASSLFGTNAQYPNSPSAGVYNEILSLLSTPDVASTPGGISSDGLEGEPQQGFLFPGDLLKIMAGIFTLDYAFFNADRWAQTIRWVIVIAWLGPMIARAIIFSISWLLNRRSQ